MPRGQAWTVEQIRALGAATSLATAAAVLGIGRTLAYELVATGQFPVPVIRADTRVVAPVAPLLKLLHAEDPQPAEPGAATDVGAGARLDRGGEPRVDATTPNPADWRLPAQTRRS
jgi:hypothetical protein